MRKRCTKGKSCGATCIVRSDRCVLELGPIISKSLSQVRSKLGVVKLYEKVREQKIKGFQAKFNRIRGELKGEVGGQIRRTADVLELKNRLQKEGLLPKTKKSEPSDLGAIFAKQIEAGKKREERAPSVPSDLKRQLAALGGGVAKSTPPSPKKDSIDAALNDISRILRGQTPQDIQLGTAPGWSGFKNQFGLTPSGSGSATGNTKWAREDAKDFDGDLGKVRREGSKSYDGWKDSYDSGAKKIGEGSYGTVMRNPDGTFVKRGAISNTEAALIERLGKVDLGPKLKAADINGEHPYQRERFVDIKNGRIAMGEVPGKPIGMAGVGKQIGGKNVADIYWKAMADLHRLGIAHNDAHIDNILVDGKGKGRWVDLGLAQASPKAALAEAMGVFNFLKGGDAVTVPGTATGEGNWQTKRWDATGYKLLDRYLTLRERGSESMVKARKELEQYAPLLAKITDNKTDVIVQLRKMGLDTNEINSIIAHGIRSPMESYDKSDGFGRITDKQAQEVLNILYDGI